MQNEPFPLDSSDLTACHALDHLALGGLWTLEQWRRELEASERPGMGLNEGTHLVAMACGWLVLDELHVTAVAVAPRRRREGLGRRVLTALLAHSRAMGAERATLEVAAGNREGLALYAGLGFRNAGIRRAYYRNGDDALIQWLDLNKLSTTGSVYRRYVLREPKNVSPPR